MNEIIVSVDPRTGEGTPTGIRNSASEDVAAACAAASSAAQPLDLMGRPSRAIMLEVMAEDLGAKAEEIVDVANRETALGRARLSGELKRACDQLRLFAAVLGDGGYLEAIVDHRDLDAGTPDLRRMLVPIGPVAVFGASNFPLAFSVPGGDTASALASGCPVIIKAHESHPQTAALCGVILQEAANRAHAPHGTVSVIHGRDAGLALVTDPNIRAVGFTGSISGGRALLDAINNRPEPVPFFGEFGSSNPVFVMESAAQARGEEIGRGVVESMKLALGQFCTKPGIIFVPQGKPGDSLVEAMVAGVSEETVGWMLNDGMARSFATGVERLSAHPGVIRAAIGLNASGRGFVASPQLLLTDSEHMSQALTEECFGPVLVAVRYFDLEDLIRVAKSLPPSLAFTFHAEPADLAAVLHLSAIGVRKSGRIVFNGYPTGLAVNWAQNHGGPWPASNSAHTSVGATAIRRFMRPVAWQEAPESALPPELREPLGLIPARVDGALQLSRQQP